ncbi:MAG: hypothetical protein DRO39_08075 [Thermoprotei archaeon]|nr:MAG: hypothetical protein DRO39_08075 [Thermoprotei archaeon]
MYEGLDPGDAYVLELLNSYFSRSMDRWSCIATPCSCRGFEMYSGGRGRISRGVITTFRALSIAALPVLLFILSGVAMATVRGVEMLHEIYENLSRSVREMFEDLYSAPLHQVAPVLKRCVDSLREELDRERVIEILESSGIESLELTAYFMKVL